MYSRLTIFLNKHNIITEVQNGFREQNSTITAIQSFIEKNMRSTEWWIDGSGYIILFNEGICCIESYDTAR